MVTKMTADDLALYFFLFRKNVKSTRDARIFSLWWKVEGLKRIQQDDERRD